jgi:hypothetical protein
MRDSQGRWLPLAGDERDDDGRHSLSRAERQKGYQQYLRSAIPSRVRAHVRRRITVYYQSRR